METQTTYTDNVDSWEKLTFLYSSALKATRAKMDVLSEEFKFKHNYSPIEYVKSRMKEPDSIVKKLIRHGKEPNLDNMVKYINDIAGIRIVCSFTSDIYRIAEMIGKQKDLTVLSVKDYIKNPKPSGYRSYHMLVTIPIFLSDRELRVKVEIQIRTIAMDFWASLEHKINYKFEGNVPDYILGELQDCARAVSDLDAKMLALNVAVQQANPEMNI